MDFNNYENLDFQLNKIAADTIKKYREKSGMSLEEVVKKMDNSISRQRLFKYENNLARMKNKIFQDICHALGENSTDIWNEINNILISNLLFDNAEPIAPNTEIIKIPVLGTIKAGIPVEAQEDIIDYIDIPKDWTKGNKKYFALKISGDSMTPNYLDGDIVIFLSTNEFESGQDCAVMVNGYDATFKKVAITDNGLLLQPYNIGNYDLKFYTKEEVATLPVKIIGVAKERRTRL